MSNHPAVPTCSVESAERIVQSEDWHY